MPRCSARRNKEKRRELEREKDIEIIQRRLVGKERRGGSNIVTSDQISRFFPLPVTVTGSSAFFHLEQILRFRYYRERLTLLASASSDTNVTIERS